MASAAVTLQSPPEPRALYWPDGLRESLGLHDIIKTLSNLPRHAADIKFHPDEAAYEVRRAIRVSQGGLAKFVPSGWPMSLSGPLVWKGSDFRNDAEFVYHLTEFDKNEIRRAVEQVIEQNLSFDDINEETFVIPGLRSRLKEAQGKIYNGIGFMVLRGLDVDEYSSKERLMIFLGISSYLAARKGAQDQAGNLVNNLVDYGRVDSDVDLPIHTDITADIVATLTLKCSDYGGEAIVASSWTVYNELAASRPDLIHVLAQPDWPFDTYGREPEYYNRPLLFYHDGKILINFSRRVLTGHPLTGRTKGIPGLTEAQAEALDTVHFIAKKHKLNFATEKGDMRFINNFAVLHGREAYSDHNMDLDLPLDEAERRSQRHLLRLWLHNEEMSWKLPPALKLVWARTFDESRRRTWDAAKYMPRESPSPSPEPQPQPHPQPEPEPEPQPETFPCD